MNNVLDRFNEINVSLTNLNNRIESIEKKFNSLGTIENIQKIDEKVVQIESSVNNQINTFKQYMYEYLENIKWKEA
jgi:predicted  nucleic acid-binding Zn-ribbon protein